MNEFHYISYKISVVMLSLSLGSPANAAAPSPAKVDHPIKETELSTITLTQEAEHRLGLVVATVERRELAQLRELAGEITVPARAGAANNSSPQNGQSVLAILPLLSPAEQLRLAQAQIDADGQVEQAKVQLNGAKQSLQRAEQMQTDKVGTGRSVDDARVQASLTENGLQTAKLRRELLGPALLATTNPTEVWVRVAVYAGDLPKFDTHKAASISVLGDGLYSTSLKAAPIQAPPSANAVAATLDVFYKLSNRDGAFRLGQRVKVRIPMQASASELTIPWSAIVYDVEGGAWVYQQIAPLVYQRRRVQVQRVVGDLTALSGDITVGSKVVVTGVAELFGTEFGIGK
ncbi:MAG: membrane fusion protein MtrC [Methyloglobulus sp.]|nr:membrane fusion protein MtrC [Methyloglobulus sp.]